MAGDCMTLDYFQQFSLLNRISIDHSSMQFILNWNFYELHAIK